MDNIFIHSILTDLFPNERLGRNNKNMIKSLFQISPNGDTLSKLEHFLPESTRQEPTYPNRNRCFKSKYKQNNITLAMVKNNSINFY